MDHWRKLANINVSSAAYLYNLAHDKIKLQYDKNLAEKELNEARELQSYLQDLKNYTKKLSTFTPNYYNDQEWQLFLSNLLSVGGRNNRQLNKLFRVPDTASKRQHRFEQDLNAVIQAANKTLQQSLPSSSIQGGNITIGLGQKSTNVQVNQELFANSIDKTIVDPVIKFFGVKSKQHFLSIGKTGYGLTALSVKIDSAGSNTAVTLLANYDLNKITSFLRFAYLMDSASFTAKNYANLRTLSLDTQQTLRGVLDLLPLLSDNSKFNGDTLVAFVHALVERAEGRAKISDSHDNDIDESLSRIDFIYRLTGRGQTYNDVLSDELKSFLKQGAKYLIFNEHNGDNIYVTSTRYIIYQRLNVKNNLPPLGKWGHSMSVAKHLIKGK